MRWAFLAVCLTAIQLYRVEGEIRPLVCYYSNWAQYRNGPGKFTPALIEPNLCTHVVFGYAKVENNSLTNTTTKDADLYAELVKLKEKDDKVIILLAVGGLTHKQEAFSAMVSTDANIDAFADSAIAYLRHHSFQGLDIAWESPGIRGSPASDRQRFTVLLERLRVAIDKEANQTKLPRLLLTVTVRVGPLVLNNSYEIDKIHINVDFVVLLAHDFHGFWDKKLGHNSPLFPFTGVPEEEKRLCVNWVVREWLNHGTPRSKVVISFPTYGRVFKLPPTGPTTPGSPAPETAPKSSITGSDSILTYYEICQLVPGLGWQRVWMNDSYVPYAFGPTADNSTRIWVGYDDSQSIVAKAKYVSKHGLLGAAVWSLDLDDFNNTCGLGYFPLTRTARDALLNFTLYASNQSRPSPPSADQAGNTTAVSNGSNTAQKEETQPAVLASLGGANNSLNDSSDLQNGSANVQKPDKNVTVSSTIQAEAKNTTPSVAPSAPDGTGSSVKISSNNTNVASNTTNASNTGSLSNTSGTQDGLKKNDSAIGDNATNNVQNSSDTSTTSIPNSGNSTLSATSPQNNTTNVSPGIGLSVQEGVNNSLTFSNKSSNMAINDAIGASTASPVSNSTAGASNNSAANASDGTQVASSGPPTVDSSQNTTSSSQTGPTSASATASSGQTSSELLSGNGLANASAAPSSLATNSGSDKMANVSNVIQKGTNNVKDATNSTQIVAENGSLSNTPQSNASYPSTNSQVNDSKVQDAGNGSQVSASNTQSVNASNVSNITNDGQGNASKVQNVSNIGQINASNVQNAANGSQDNANKIQDAASTAQNSSDKNATKVRRSAASGDGADIKIRQLSTGSSNSTIPPGGNAAQDGNNATTNALNGTNDPTQGNAAQGGNNATTNAGNGTNDPTEGTAGVQPVGGGNGTAGNTGPGAGATLGVPAGNATGNQAVTVAGTDANKTTSANGNQQDAINNLNSPGNTSLTPAGNGSVATANSTSPNNASCNSGNSTAANSSCIAQAANATEMEDPRACERKGIFPDLQECRRYYMCFNQRKVYFVCPRSMAFDLQTLACNNRYYVTSCRI